MNHSIDVKKTSKSHKSSSKKKKTVKETSPIIEIGDTQGWFIYEMYNQIGIEFKDGLEYVANIINDGVIPNVSIVHSINLNRIYLMKNLVLFK